MIKVGQRLKEARLEKKLSLEDVAKETKIRASFLSAIESGDYHKLPSPSYAQGFVRNYASFLGLSEREMIILFRREFDQEKEVKVLPKGFVEDKPLPVSRFKVSQAIAGLILLVFLVGGFLLYQYRHAFLDPKLEISTPEENAVVSQDITVKGETDPNVTLLVNDEPVTVEDSGRFTKTVSAFPGATVVTIEAENNFGRKTVVERTVQVRPGS